MMYDALVALSVGDAFGETFFKRADARGDIAARRLAPGPWRWTDDTAMARAIVEVLTERRQIDSDHLALVFAQDFMDDPTRGYGGGAQEVLGAIGRGKHWTEAAGAAFDGQGSMGNGAAMRAAPIGARFPTDLDRVVREATASAVPTHAHPDGVAGAIAVAVAAAVATRGGTGDDVWDAVLSLTPIGATHTGLQQAIAFPRNAPVGMVAAALGTGSRVTSSDTVPFTMWCVTRHLDDFEAALWTTVAGLGDRDTTCAIVAGILGGRLGRAMIPPAWLAATEPLDRQDLEPTAPMLP